MREHNGISPDCESLSRNTRMCQTDDHCYTTTTRKKNKQNQQITAQDKQDVLMNIVNLVHDNVRSFVHDADMYELYTFATDHFFDLRKFLHLYTNKQTLDNDKCASFTDVEVSQWRCSCNDVVMNNAFIVAINSLPRRQQEHLMLWVFKNEDRVWRLRGGRPGHETPDDYLSMMKSPQLNISSSDDKTLSYVDNTVEPFPGFVLLSSNMQDCEKLDTSNVVGYCVGEWISHCEYEITTAWVSPRYNGLGFATRLYMNTMEHVPANVFVFDLIHGGLERAVRVICCINADVFIIYVVRFL